VFTASATAVKIATATLRFAMGRGTVEDIHKRAWVGKVMYYIMVIMQLLYMYLDLYFKRAIASCIYYSTTTGTLLALKEGCSRGGQGSKDSAELRGSPGGCRLGGGS
jgi:hypothetical protein